MPLYEWQCENCGKVEETISSWDVDAPMCCGKVMERKLSACHWSFGWRLSDESHHVRFHKDELVRNI